MCAFLMKLNWLSNVPALFVVGAVVSWLFREKYLIEMCRHFPTKYNLRRYKEAREVLAHYKEVKRIMSAMEEANGRPF